MRFVREAVISSYGKANHNGYHGQEDSVDSVKIKESGTVVSSGRGNTSLTYHCRPSLTAAPYAQPEYQTPTFYADDYLTARPQTPNPQLYAHPNQCL